MECIVVHRRSIGVHEGNIEVHISSNGVHSGSGVEVLAHFGVMGEYWGA